MWWKKPHVFYCYRELRALNCKLLPGLYHCNNFHFSIELGLIDRHTTPSYQTGHSSCQNRRNTQKDWRLMFFFSLVSSQNSFENTINTRHRGYHVWTFHFPLHSPKFCFSVFYLPTLCWVCWYLSKSDTLFREKNVHLVVCQSTPCQAIAKMRHVYH